MLCPECRAALTGVAPCRVRPVPEPAGLSVVHAAAPYGDEVRALLLAHKERGALALAAPLGVALAGAVRAGLGPAVRPGQTGWPTASRGPQGFGKGDVRGERERADTVGAAVRAAGAGHGPVLLVPVPSARRVVRARGHDPTRRIALAAAGELRRTGTAKPGCSVCCGRSVPWPTSRG